MISEKKTMAVTRGVTAWESKQANEQVTEACTKQDWKTKTQNYVGRKGATDRKGAGREVKIIKTHHTKFLKKKK